MISEGIYRRLISLSDAVDTLSQYKFAEKYGHSYDGFRQLERDVAGYLGLDNLQYTSQTSGIRRYLQKIDSERLKRAEQHVQKIFHELHQKPEYLAALGAYAAGDQEALKIALPEVFTFISPAEGVETVHHGVYPRQSTHGQWGADFPSEQPLVKDSISPQAYIDRLLHIMENGLIPSQGSHTGTDANLRPVFTCTRRDKLHGLLYVSFSTEDYVAFVSDDVDERLIYANPVRAKMRLSLKSESAVREFEEGSTEVRKDLEAFLAYRSELEKALDARGVEYEKGD